MFSKIDRFFQNVWKAVCNRNAKSVVSRPWQYRALKQFSDANKVQHVIIAPTGSGKSVLQISDAMRQAEGDAKLRVITASHSKQLVKAFSHEILHMPMDSYAPAICVLSVVVSSLVSGFYSAWAVPFVFASMYLTWKQWKNCKATEWKPAICFLKSAGNIRKFVEFVQLNNAAEFNRRSMTCCHATMARAGARISDDHLQNLMVIVDECDLARCNNNPNMLGRFLNRVYDRACIPGNPHNLHLVLATATPIRIDGGVCVPGSTVVNNQVQVNPITTSMFVHEKHEHLQQTGITISPILDGIRSNRGLIKSLSKRFRKGNFTKTLMFVPLKSALSPSTNPDYASAKYDFRDRCLQAISGFVKAPNWKDLAKLETKQAYYKIHRKDGQIFTVVDLVDVPNQAADEARREYLHKLREGTIPTPDNLVIVALRKFTRGYDLPCLERIINLGQDMSLTMAEQKFGRLLRSFPGKSKVEFVQYVRCPRTTSDEKMFRKLADKFFTAYLALGCEVSELRETVSALGTGTGRRRVLLDCIMPVLLSNVRASEINLRIKTELIQKGANDITLKGIEITPELLKLLRRSFHEQQSFCDATLKQEFNFPAGKFSGELLSSYRKLLHKDKQKTGRYIHPTDEDLAQRGMQDYISLRRVWVSEFAQLHYSNNAAVRKHMLLMRMPLADFASQAALKIVEAMECYKNASKSGKLQEFLSKNGLDALSKHIACK